jgi:hypothetical protein
MICVCAYNCAIFFDQVTISPTPPKLVEEFRQQERERFKHCDKAFVYVQAGVKSVVAPIKGLGKASGKARDHPLLKPDRFTLLFIYLFI